MSKASVSIPLPGYETTILTRMDMPESAFQNLKKKVEGVIKNFKGKIHLEEDWGKKRLSYKVKKEGRAQYTYLVYSGEPSVVAELERNLRLNDQVLRYLTVKLDQEFDFDHWAKVRAEKASQASRRAPVEF